MKEFITDNFLASLQVVPKSAVKGVINKEIHEQLSMGVFDKNDARDYSESPDCKTLVDHIQFYGEEKDVDKASILESFTHKIYYYTEEIEAEKPKPCSLDHVTVKTMFRVMSSVRLVDGFKSYTAQCPECLAVL